MNKKIIFPVMAVLGGALVLFGVTQSYAQTTPSNNTSIISRLAQKFGLKEADVKVVFDEERVSRHQEMQSNLDERLTRAVTDGKITESQKQAILTKMNEFHTNMTQNSGEFKNLTPEQRKSQMQAKRTELEAWAKEQGLELSTLQEYIGRGGFGMKMHGGWHMRMN